MKSSKLQIFCVTNKIIPKIEETNYQIAGVGKDNFPKGYLKCNTKDNIFYKEEYYSELTFHYWYWKNLIDFSNNNWIGFCQKRRYWIKSSSEKNDIDQNNIKKHLLCEPEEDWDKYESIICQPIIVKGAKKIKILKRGWRSVIKNPSILINENYQNIKLHFDMHHGYGNLNKAISLINDEDRADFLDYSNNSTSYNPHIMFIAKPKIADKWFGTLFPWLLRCEKEFGFKNLYGYDTQRLYAYLAERYLSFWFNKHTNTIAWPWKFFDASQN